MFHVPSLWLESFVLFVRLQLLCSALQCCCFSRINYFQSNDKEMKRRRLKIKSLTSSAYNFFFFLHTKTLENHCDCDCNCTSQPKAERRKQQKITQLSSWNQPKPGWLPVGIFFFGFRFALQSGVYCCCLSCFVAAAFLSYQNIFLIFSYRRDTVVTIRTQITCVFIYLFWSIRRRWWIYIIGLIVR